MFRVYLKKISNASYTKNKFGYATKIMPCFKDWRKLIFIIKLALCDIMCCNANRNAEAMGLRLVLM